MSESFQEKIRNRAHQRWKYREQHGIPGTPEEDWLRSESDLGLFHGYVALAAYFNFKHRCRLGIPGTPNDD